VAVPSIQDSLNAGEISPELYGIVSLEKYSSAATTLRNFIVNYRGGALSRPGLIFIGRCKQNPPHPPRPLPFQFSNNQGYILEFGDTGGGYVRFVFQGAYVTESPVSATGATNANPCVVSVSGTPFNNGDWVFASGFGGITQLNGQTFIIAGAMSGSVQLQDLNGNSLNSTSFGTYTSGGTLARIYTISSPYAAVDLPYLKFSESADVLSLTCSNPVTGSEYPPYDLTRLGAASWSLQQTSFAAAISPPSTISATAMSCWPRSPRAPTPRTRTSCWAPA